MVTASQLTTIWLFITVGEGRYSSLTLCDCNGSGNNTGEITHVDGMKGRRIFKPFQ